MVDFGFLIDFFIMADPIWQGKVLMGQPYISTLSLMHSTYVTDEYINFIMISETSYVTSTFTNIRLKLVQTHFLIFKSLTFNSEKTE